VRTQTVEVRNLRYVGAAMLGAAAVWPLLPVHPPLTCPLRATTGIPCPLCGMTRAVVAAVRGDVGASLRYNPGGVLLVALAVVVAVVGWRWERFRLPALVLPIALGLLWAYNVTLNPTF
jgi:hypothetical protein